MAKRTYWKLCNTNIVDVLSVAICSEREHLHKHQLPVAMHLSVTVVPCWYSSMCFHKDSRNIHVHSHHSLSSLTAVYYHISTTCMHLILSTHTLPSGEYCKYMWTSFNVWLLYSCCGFNLKYSYMHVYVKSREAGHQGHMLSH